MARRVAERARLAALLRTAPMGEAQAYQSMFEWRETIRARLADSYDESVFRLGLNKSAEIERALKPMNEILLPASIDVGELLKKRQEVWRFVTSINELNKKWTNLSKELAQQFGLSEGNFTVERVGQLARIAFLCSSGNKPEAEWFDPVHFRQVQEIVPRAKRDFREYSSLRNRIEKTYNDKVYGLDLDELVKRYRGPNQGFLRWFRASAGPGPAPAAGPMVGNHDRVVPPGLSTA